MIGRWITGQPQAQLHAAITKGDVAAVKKCIANKVDVNTLFSGKPPLCSVLAYDCTVDVKTRCEMAQLLVDAGAKPDLPSNDGFCALHFTWLSAAFLKIFLSAKSLSNINIKDIYGRTPLHIRAQHGNAEECQLLIDAGADVNAINKYGDTPLMEAVSWGNSLPIPVLLAAGADINIKNKEGQTALTRKALTSLAAPLDPARGLSHSGEERAHAKCQELVAKHIELVEKKQHDRKQQAEHDKRTVTPALGNFAAHFVLFVVCFANVLS